MMKSTLRPTFPNDVGALRQFLCRAFGSAEDAPFLDPAVMAWKYWERRDDWAEPRAYVLERDGAIVAHAGVMPMTFGAGEVRGVQMIDWASAPEAPGAGVALVQKLVARFDFIYSIGGSDLTQRALPAFGFVEHARHWNGARPLRPLRQILTHQHRNWKLAPRLVRNWAWSLPTSANGGLRLDWTWEQIEPREICEEIQSSGCAVFGPRQSAFFDYLLRCPTARIRLYCIRDQGGLNGHFAISTLRSQARIAGVWLRDPSPAAWQTAFCIAQRVARLEGANEVVAGGTDGESEQAASRSGLRIIRHIPVYLLNKKRKLDLRQDFQFQLCDYDGFFLDMGNASYWT
jgi:hypothetical protein